MRQLVNVLGSVLKLTMPTRTTRANVCLVMKTVIVVLVLRRRFLRMDVSNVAALLLKMIHHSRSSNALIHLHTIARETRFGILLKSSILCKTRWSVDFVMTNAMDAKTTETFSTPNVFDVRTCIRKPLTNASPNVLKTSILMQQRRQASRSSFMNNLYFSISRFKLKLCHFTGMLAMS